MIDRDSPATPDEFHLLPGAVPAIRMINEAGFLAVVVSNQPGIVKGRLTAEDLDAVTQKMHHELARTVRNSTKCCSQTREIQEMISTNLR